MRITGGSARGIPLTCPQGKQTRPATDQLREAVFSSLGPFVEGSKVCDLFAGSGAYGLEALSRGAPFCDFFENNGKVRAALQQNLAAVARCLDTAPASLAKVHPYDVYKLQQNADRAAGAGASLIFVDPPYHAIAENFTRLFAGPIAALAGPKAVVVFELPGDLEARVDGWSLKKRLGKAGKDKPTAAIFTRD